MPYSITRHRLIDLLKQLGVAAVYALLIHIEHSHFENDAVMGSFEPASGLALAVLLIFGKRYVWSVFLGAFFANAMQIPFMEAIAISSGDTLQAFCGAWLLTRNARFDRALHSLNDYLRLISLGGCISVGIGALIAVTALLVSGSVTPETYFPGLLDWWMGDMLGVTLITPLILVCWQAKNDGRGAKQMAEDALLLGLTFLVGQIVFLGWFHASVSLLEHVAKGYWIFLCIVWVAVRSGVRGTVIALVMAAIQGLLGAYHGVGFFADDIAQTQLVNYWFYTLTLSVVCMALATYISGQRRSEEALRQSELKFRTLYDSTSEAVTLMDEKGFFDCNPAALAMFGCATKEEFSTKHPADISPPQQPDGTNSLLLANQHIATAMTKGSHRFEWTCKRLDTGKIFIVDALLSVMELDGRAVLQAVSRDITERRHNEELLRKSKERLRTYLDNISDTIWVVRENLDIIYVSSGVTRLMGIVPEESIGRPSAMFIHPDDMDAIGNAMQYLTGHPDEPQTVQYRVKHKDGRWIPVESTGINLLNNPAINGVLVTMRDITERKAIEQQLHDLSAHILDIREQEKSHIAREIHDELGGTLTALKIDTHWLLRKLPVNEETAVFIERAHSMSQRIDNAINTTRHIIDNMRPTILDDLGLLAAIEWQASEFQKNTGIECTVNCIEDEANLDNQRSIALFRILQEILTNASRHSGASRVEIEFHHRENEVILIVADNGCGIPENHMAISKSYGSKSYGMLGMTERVNQLGGKILFSSPQGGGFSVEVALPLPAEDRSAR